MLKVMILLGLAICSFGFFAEAMLDEPNNAPGEPPASTNTNQLPAGQAGLIVRNSNGLAKLRLLGQPNNVPAPEEPPASTNTNHPPAGQAGLIVRNPLNSTARRRLFGAPDSPIRVGNGPPLDKEGTEIDPIPITNFASRRMLRPKVRSPASPGRSPLSRKSADHSGKGHHPRGFDQLVEEEGASANAEVHQSKRDQVEKAEEDMTRHSVDHGDSPVQSPLLNADDQQEQKRRTDIEKVMAKFEGPEHFRDHPIFERERHQSPAGSHHRNVQQQGMLPTSLPHSPTAHRHMLPMGWQHYFPADESKVFEEDKVAGKQTSMNDEGEPSLEGSSFHANSIRSKTDGQQQRQYPAAGSDIAGSAIAVVEKQQQNGEGKSVKAEKEGGIEASDEAANEREQSDKLEDTLDGM